MLTQIASKPAQGIRLLEVGSRLVQIATITSKSTRGKPLRFYPPFPYNEKRFKWYHALFDNTILRVSGENSKVIVVEGPIGVGKSAFCKAIAEELEMQYLPQPTMDDVYISPGGFDLRQIDDQIPEEVRTYDHKNFCVTPKTWKAALFQVNMLYLRFYQYFDALCHLFNTGQGVILERSYYSDYVFMLAMYKSGFVSKTLKDAYLTIKRNSSTFLLHPHLIIYLDIPVPVVQERIRTRNYSWEQNSPALTKEYLTNLEALWKQNYLREASEKAEILIYDWTDGGDVDVVIDDIEKLDMDVMRRDRKFREWWLLREELYDLRLKVTNNRTAFDQYFFYPWFKIDEVPMKAEHWIKVNEIMSEVPETQYDKGYNPLLGDSIFSMLFKTKMENHRDPCYFLNFYKPLD